MGCHTHCVNCLCHTDCDSRHTSVSLQTAKPRPQQPEDSTRPTSPLQAAQKRSTGRHLPAMLSYGPSRLRGGTARARSLDTRIYEKRQHGAGAIQKPANHGCRNDQESGKTREAVHGGTFSVERQSRRGGETPGGSPCFRPGQYGLERLRFGCSIFLCGGSF